MSSYSLKHTAEKFLRPHCTYVSSGRIVWVAVALGLPMVEDGGLNLLIGMSEREHNYVRRRVMGNDKPHGHQRRPAGLTHLQRLLGSARPVNLFSAAGRDGGVGGGVSVP